MSSSNATARRKRGADDNRFALTPDAERDLDEGAAYLALHAGLDIALRFSEKTEQAFSILAANPHIGWKPRFRHHELGRVRVWHVPQFERWLVFYSPTNDGIEVLRVLHGSRDLERILKE